MQTAKNPIAVSTLKIVTGLPAKLPHIMLTHGQAIWLLVALGYSDGVAEQTFYEYIKSLRKLGIPFGQRTLKSRDKTLAHYHYCELMELAVTLALRVYHVRILCLERLSGTAPVFGGSIATLTNSDSSAKGLLFRSRLRKELGSNCVGAFSTLAFSFRAAIL